MFPTRSFEWLVINALQIFFAYFSYLKPLENWPSSSYSFREANKKMTSYTEFVLKLRERNLGDGKLRYFCEDFQDYELLCAT